MRQGIFSSVVYILLSCSFVVGAVQFTNPLEKPCQLYPSATLPDCQELLNQTCMVYHYLGHGTGTIVTRKIKVGGVLKDYSFVLTCGHVIDRLLNKDGILDDSTLFGKQLIYKDNKPVGERVFKLKVIKFADRNNEDVGVLLVDEDLSTKFTKFLLDKDGPSPIGSSILHIGAPKSTQLINSVLFGHISSVGRIVENREFDQIQCGIFGGCSGGGVYNEKGEFIGMVARTWSESYGLMIPIREVRKYLSGNKLGWILEGVPPENLEDCQ